MMLVTGATGMNGSAVVRELVRRKIQVRALVRDRARAAALGPSPSVELVEGDLLREETLGRALDGVTRALLIPRRQTRRSSRRSSRSSTPRRRRASGTS